MDFRQFVARAGANPLDYEIAQEQAAALGRLGRTLERALAALAAFDHDSGHNEPTKHKGAHDDPSSNTAARLVLLQAASDALWCFIVQREACGLRDPRPVIRDYRVPQEVQNRMGMFGGIETPRRPRT